MHKGAPFRELSFHFSRSQHYLSARQHSEALSSAYAIHWAFQYTNVNKPKRRSTDLLSMSAASFRHVLSILSISSSLHTLSLSWLKVGSAHQILILSIKTLRTLELIDSIFTPTSVVMPRSSITALLFEGRALVPIRHLLALLGNSLERLRVKRWRISAFEILASMPLPRLTFFENSTIINVPRHDYLASFQNIRTLVLSFLASGPFPPTALPHLTYLFAPPDIGKVLLPGRPVHTYRMHPAHYQKWVASIEGPLVQVALRGQHVKELHLWLDLSPWGMARWLALHFPNVVWLHLGLSSPSHLCDGMMPWSHVHVNSSLRKFDIGFYMTKGGPIPRENCREVLSKLTEVCSMLEAVRFGELCPTLGGGIDEKNVSWDRVMDMRRTAGGEWQERKWHV